MFFSFGPEISYQALASSGIVNDSGKPQALYFGAFLSGGTAGVLTLFDGTSSLGTRVFAVSGTISSWTPITPAAGLVFPKGLYVSFDSNVSVATVWTRQV